MKKYTKYIEKNIAIKREEETQERRKASTGEEGRKNTKKGLKNRRKTVREKHKRVAKKI